MPPPFPWANPDFQNPHAGPDTPFPVEGGPATPWNGGPDTTYYPEPYNPGTVGGSVLGGPPLPQTPPPPGSAIKVTELYTYILLPDGTLWILDVDGHGRPRATQFPPGSDPRQVRPPLGDSGWGPPEEGPPNTIFDRPLPSRPQKPFPRVITPRPPEGWEWERPPTPRPPVAGPKPFFPEGPVAGIGQGILDAAAAFGGAYIANVQAQQCQQFYNGLINTAGQLIDYATKLQESLMSDIQSASSKLSCDLSPDCAAALDAWLAALEAMLGEVGDEIANAQRLSDIAQNATCDAFAQLVGAGDNMFMQNIQNHTDDMTNHLNSIYDQIQNVEDMLDNWDTACLDSNGGCKPGRVNRRCRPGRRMFGGIIQAGPFAGQLLWARCKPNFGRPGGGHSLP